MRCENCKHMNEEGVKFCVKCGHKLEESKKERKSRKGLVIALLVVVVVLGGVAAWFLLRSPEPPVESAPSEPQQSQQTVEPAVEQASTEAEPETASLPAIVPIRAGLNQYSWAELAALSDQLAACKDEQEMQKMAVDYHVCRSDGTIDTKQTKTLTLSDGTDCAVQVIGINHDTLTKSGAGKAGLTFMFVSCPDKRPMMSSDDTEGGWKRSALRAWLNGAFIEKLPEDLSEHLASVEKLTNNEGQTQDPSSVSATYDLVWLPSLVELNGQTQLAGDLRVPIYALEGEQYQLFDEQGVVADEPNAVLARTMAGGNEEVMWWTRSPGPLEGDGFACVSERGETTEGAQASAVVPYLPAFCLSAQ